MEQLTMKMGVLSDTQLLTYDYRSKQYGRLEIDSTEVWLIDQLISCAHHYEIDTLWITPGSSVSRLGAAMLQLRDDDHQLYLSKNRDGTPRFLLIYRKWGNKKSVKIGFPEWDNRWKSETHAKSWQDITDPDTLFRSILYLQDALQFEVAWSPGHTGQELLLALNEKRSQWLAPVELPDVIKRNLPVDMRWKKPLTGQEARPGMWLHLFDGNSKYLGACTGAEVGEGEPRHFLMPDSHSSIGFEARMPGMWNVEGWGWKWTPELEYLFACLDDKGQARPAIVEAYIWQTYHETLRTFGEHLWEARCTLKFGITEDFHDTDKNARDLAYEAFKSVYTQGLGWLTHPSGDNKLFRPDMWAQIVATCYRSMGFKVRQLEKLGMRVVYVNVDTIGLVSDSPDLSPYEKVILNRQTQLGGFRHYGTLPMSIDLAGTFEENIKFRDCQNLINDSLKCAKEMLV